jgi:hypothetical protein
MVVLRVSLGHTISEKGHFRKSDRAMRGAACPSTADKRRLHRNVGFVPKPEVTSARLIRCCAGITTGRLRGSSAKTQY